MSYSERRLCGLCSSESLTEVMALEPTPLANEFVRTERASEKQEKIPLTLSQCVSCGHYQLIEIVEPKTLFENYVYVSGTSAAFVEHFQKLAQSCAERFALSESSLIVDIGSNDGTLLKQFQKLGKTEILGIDPAVEIAKEARMSGVPTLQGFFTKSLGRELCQQYGPAKLITATNVFAHMAGLRDFVTGVECLLDRDGVFVFEVSYFASVVDKLLFDTIYHEHLSYHTATPLIRFFEGVGLKLFDAEVVPTHGGSLRGYVCRKGLNVTISSRLSDLLAMEKLTGGYSPQPSERPVSIERMRRFKARICEQAKKVRERLEELKTEGLKIAGYGAPAKLTTLMHEFKLNPAFFEFIVDDSPWKQGLLTPGMLIPVVHPSKLLTDKPDVAVVFAWNFAQSIVERNQFFLERGGRFLVPLPELREVGKA